MRQHLLQLRLGGLRPCKIVARFVEQRFLLRNSVLVCTHVGCVLRAHLGVRDGDPVVVLAERPGAVLRVELDPYPRGRFRPLLLQVLGRRDHGHLLHDMVVQQPGGERQREGRLAGAGCGDGEEITRLLLDVPLQRPLLPGTQLVGGAPGGAGGGAGSWAAATGAGSTSRFKRPPRSGYLAR